MPENRKFHTFRGYELQRQGGNRLSAGMEDYLEMVCRLCKGRGYTRISDLAAALSVRPPSASRMVRKLAGMSYVDYERYGVIQLTPRGKKLGSYLLQRHETIEGFLRLLGVTEGVLTETEAIEHNLSRETVWRIMMLVNFLRENDQWLVDFRRYQEQSVFPGKKATALESSEKNR